VIINDILFELFDTKLSNDYVGMNIKEVNVRRERKNKTRNETEQ